MRRGIFVDLDGTLADNLDLMFAVYATFLEGFGCVGTAEEFNSLNGSPLRKVVELLRVRHALTGSLDTLLRTYTERLDEMYMCAHPNLGARAIFAEAKRAGWTVAVVTSNTHFRTTKWLAYNDLMPLVDCVISGGDCEGKPSPAPYLMALEKAGCLAEQSIAVEDSLQGIQSALAARLTTYCYVNSGNREISLPGSVRRISHFDELTAVLI